ncbi:MAG: NADH-quinone oxidoreductase subunit C [Elusimicrobiales bacterium]|jgi:Ni,Fe-hydrogenase III component G
MSEFEKEEKYKAKLEAKFGAAVSGVAVQRKNRVWLEIPADKLVELVQFMKTELGYDHLSTITGFDGGENLGANYHLTDTHGVITARVKTPRTDPHLPTVTAVFPGAEPYERELADLFGIKIDGLKPGRRYPLPDDFPADQYPLRKDWKTADAYPVKTSQEAE